MSKEGYAKLSESRRPHCVIGCEYCNLLLSQITLRLVPLPVGVNYPFKCYLKKSYYEWRDERTQTTKKGYLKKPDLQNFINFVSSVWEKITVSTVQNAFSGAQITPEPLYMRPFF